MLDCQERHSRRFFGSRKRNRCFSGDIARRGPLDAVAASTASPRPRSAPPLLRGGLLLGLLLACGAATRADELDRAAAETLSRYAGQLEQLAQWSDQQGLTAQAKTSRAWLSQRPVDQMLVAVFPRTAGSAASPKDAPAAVVEWDQRFQQLRHEQANALESLARRAIRSGRPSLAYDLLLAALRENPDQEATRRLLGYTKTHGGWYTLWEANKLRAGQVWHDRFGWLPKAAVRRYEQGQRFANGQWISAEQDAQLHRDIRHGWDVETEHYTIHTNESLEAGVALGVKLERFYGVWVQLFLRYFASEEQLMALFDGRRDPWGRMPRHQVVYFHTREEYNDALRAAMPNIGISIGVYQESSQRAYFFAGEGYDERTLFHEATHQLFHESRPVVPDVAGQANFWAVEGIAMFMESLREVEGQQVLGGLDDVRMIAARYRLLHDKFYVPLAELTALGRTQLQADPKIATLYSESAGLTHFLIGYDNGRYRDALVNYLRAIYTGQADAETLARLTGTRYAELDKQYRAYIESAGMPKLEEKR